MKPKILIIDDEKSIREPFRKFLADDGYEVATAENYQEAVDRIEESHFDLIFADIILGDNTGIDVLKKVRERGLRCPVIMFTGAPSVETASQAVYLGAFEYLFKPIEKKELLEAAKRAIRYKNLVDEKEKYRSNLEAIFKSVKDAIITVDSKLTVIEVNDASRNVCGFLREKAIGKSLSLSQDRCEGKCLKAVEETMEKKAPVEICRLECRRKDRPYQVVTLNTYPLLDSHDLFSGAVMVAKDETRLAGLERELGERRRFKNIMGKSEEMRKIYSLMEKLADAPTTVMIKGESGTGKELIAEALHYSGNRADKPLVKVNCSALTDDLLESELFGHVKGAFTGAVEDKVGRFQKADGGTIFLDEIGDISIRMQTRLLRVLQTREFEKVGSSSTIKVDVRFLSATNQDLLEKVRQGTFREDLYFRLKVMEITVPPLRDRLEDLPLLVDHFIEKFNREFCKDINGISEEGMKKFMDYHWPGNVRELEHAMEHAFILCGQPLISLEHLPREFSGSSSSTTSLPVLTGKEDPEKILQALEKSGWNKTKAARMLKMNRTTLYQKIDKFRIITPKG